MIIKHEDGTAVMLHSVRKFRHFGDKWGVLVDGEVFIAEITKEHASTLVEEISNRFIQEEQARMIQEGKMSHDIYSICDTKPNEYRDMLDETLRHQGEVDA